MAIGSPRMSSECGNLIMLLLLVLSHKLRAWIMFFEVAEIVWMRFHELFAVLPSEEAGFFPIYFDKQLLLEPIWSSCYLNCLIHFVGAMDCEKQASL